MAINNDLEQAYAYCQKLASSHYENFPVASVLLPKHLRRPISAIYAFARTADDFADEGNASNDERLAALNGYSEALHNITNQHTEENDSPIFIALADSIHHHNLDLQLFEDLLTAFKQDVTKTRYQTYEEVRTYCQHSANPVGRLLLQLHGYKDEALLQQSDAICTALQLINFYQDIQDDYRQRNRIYLPQDELTLHSIAESDLSKETTSPAFIALMEQQYQRTATLLRMGTPLGAELTGRFGWEVRTTILAASTLLHTLKHRPTDQQLQRPKISKLQLSGILMRSLQKSYFCHASLQKLS